MATLKEHQAAMVDLLANGSGIPASASRLAHAMHDVLRYLRDATKTQQQLDMVWLKEDATTPGLNDKALSDCVESLRPKATPAERRVKELTNTVGQLKGRVAELKAERDELLRQRAGNYSEPEQAGCRKDDTQVCEHEWLRDVDGKYSECLKCGEVRNA